MWPPAKKVLLLCLFLLCIPIIVFSCFYLLFDTEQLIKWYCGLNPCFYKHETWATNFFTNRIKSDGNLYCIIAIAVSLTGLVYVPRQLRKWQPDTDGVVAIITTTDALLTVACIACSVIAWIIGNNLALPAYDEVFSAQNAAGLHPFQTISYYMLPNNHLLFNLLNSVLFHLTDDKVITGRYISLIGYATITVLLFWWLKYMLSNRWLGFFAAITLAIQFNLWGFSFQARGYELYTLAEWGMVISLFLYLQRGQKYLLVINAICIAAGYFLIPSFMYLHIAEMVFACVYFRVYRAKNRPFWKYQLSAMLLTYLLYLPALCFSGIDAIIRNKYVRPDAATKDAGIAAYIRSAKDGLAYYIDSIFSDIQVCGHSISLILFLLPLALIFDKKNKQTRLFGFFYAIMWLVFVAMIIAMRKNPFSRNMTGHYSIVLAGIILLVYRISVWIFNDKTKKIQWVLPILCMVVFCCHFISTNKKNLGAMLYGYDVNDTYSTLCDGLKCIPAESKVAVSTEGFLAGYICMRAGCTIHKCPDGEEQYLVKQSDEQMPAILADKYLLMKQVYGYDVYLHK